MPESTQIRVLAFGSAAALLGWTEREMGLTEAARLSDLIRQLEAECPPLAAARQHVRFAVNQAYAAADRVLEDGDEVAIIPPVSGGAPPAEPPTAAPLRLDVRLTHEPIAVEALLAEVADSRAGAVACFLGVVRAERSPAPGDLVALEYSAYETMALAEMTRVGEAALREFDPTALRLVHRLGRLRIGEASVVAVVAAPHRAAAMDACRWAIERLKADVPIFKREIWSDGAATWVHDVRRPG